MCSGEVVQDQDDSVLLCMLTAPYHRHGTYFMLCVILPVAVTTNCMIVTYMYLFVWPSIYILNLGNIKPADKFVYLVASWHLHKN